MTRRTDVVELAVLGVLHEAPMHGYHLRTHVTALLGPWRAALSFGTLYPTLRRLHAGDLVRSAGVAGTTSKVVYEITEPGRTRFHQLLADSGTAATTDDDAFGVRFAFFGRLDQRERVRVLESRRAKLLDRLELARGPRCGDESHDPYRRAWAQRGVASVQAELSWTEARLAAERAAPTPVSADRPFP